MLIAHHSNHSQATHSRPSLETLRILTILSEYQARGGVCVGSHGHTWPTELMLIAHVSEGCWQAARKKCAPSEDYFSVPAAASGAPKACSCRTGLQLCCELLQLLQVAFAATFRLKLTELRHSGSSGRQSSNRSSHEVKSPKLGFQEPGSGLGALPFVREDSSNSTTCPVIAILGQLGPTTEL